MDAEQPEQPSLSGFGYLWLNGLLVIAIAVYFAKLDDSIVLFPDRSTALSNTFWAAAAFGIVSAVVGYRQAAPGWIFRGIFIPFIFWAMGTCASFLVLNTAANLVLNARDFPPEKTRTFKLIFRISRANQGGARNAGGTILISPVQRYLYITRSDYEFMLNRRLPTDHGTDPKEISSQGYFCARVTAQEAGDALRIMHAEDTTLPRGSVMICPKASKK